MESKLSDDIANCAGHVQTGDPDRFLAIMACPPARRADLFVLTAFNLELARAPWVTKEAMIAEMRLQWWLDAIEEIFSNETTRRHEVVTPLADLIERHNLPRVHFDRMIQSRRWDIYAEPHPNKNGLWRYLEETNGMLMDLMLQTAGPKLSGGVGYGSACGLANLLVAFPELKNQQKSVLADNDVAQLQDMAIEGLDRLAQIAPTISKDQKSVLRMGWQARPILKRALADAQAIHDGQLSGSEFSKKLSLLVKSSVNLI